MGEREQKNFQGFVTKADENTGEVEAIVSVTGILDDDSPPDLIESGAFTKSVEERGPAGSNRIRVLNQHMWNDVIGMPTVLVERGREHLPTEVLERFPEATGGLFAKMQLVTEVQKAREALALIKAGALSEWSIGFDVLQSTMDKVKSAEDEAEQVFRRIKEIKLWEMSPVTWGANPATVTISAKQDHSGTSTNIDWTLWEADYGNTPGIVNEVTKLAVEVLDTEDPSVELSELLEKMLERLERGAEPDTPLTPEQVAELHLRLIEAELDLYGGT